MFEFPVPGVGGKGKKGKKGKKDRVDSDGWLFVPLLCRFQPQPRSTLT